MNNDCMITTLAIAATLAFATPAVHAEYVSPAFEAKLQAAADGGPAAVNQLLYRTRNTHNLSMDEALHHVQLHESDEITSAAEPGEASQGGDETEATQASPTDDAFTREFFRNDARD